MNYDPPPTQWNQYTVLQHRTIDFTSQKLIESTEKEGVLERQISA